MLPLVIRVVILWLSLAVATRLVGRKTDDFLTCLRCMFRVVMSVEVPFGVFRLLVIICRT